MWLMICEPNDYSALWLYGELEKVDVDNITLLTPDELMFGATWELHDGYQGTSFLITLDNSVVIHSAEIKGIINRVGFISVNEDNNDARYITEEWNAFFLCWLSSLDCIMLNPPQPDSLMGFWQEPAVLHNTLNHSGLSTHPITFKSNAEQSVEQKDIKHTHVLAFNGRAMDSSLPDSVKVGINELFNISNLPLMGLTFDSSDPTHWLVTDVSNFPYFELGRENIISEISNLIQDN